MAVYHVSVKTVSRSAGRSATGASAYRAGERIEDQRTGLIHDYTRKGGVVSSDLVLPADAPEWARDRAALWNAAEQAETRKNSTVAREFEVALPDELSPEQRRELAMAFAREIVDRHGCAADVSIHEPGKEGDNRNHHAHILVTTRRLEASGFTEKTRELDDKKTKEVDRWRERFAVLQNERLREAGSAARVDHRSLRDQGIDRAPTVHLGPAASGYERRTGEASRIRLDAEQRRAISERLAQAKASGDQERKKADTGPSIIDLTAQLEEAKRERQARQHLEKVQASIEGAQKAGMQMGPEHMRDLRDAQKIVEAYDRKEAKRELTEQQAERLRDAPGAPQPQVPENIRQTANNEAQERLRGAREAGEKERAQRATEGPQRPAQDQQRAKPGESAEERLRAAHEAGERERVEEHQKPRDRGWDRF